MENAILEHVREYKYLGVILASNRSFKPAISALANQSNKALFSLMKVSSALSFPPPTVMCYLFDSLIKPIMEYGAEIWGYLPADDLELIHRKMCKFILGVPSSATNLA